MDKVTTAHKAITDITDGASLSVGGFGLCGIPGVLIAAPLDKVATSYATGTTFRVQLSPPHTSSLVNPHRLLLPWQPVYEPNNRSIGIWEGVF